MAASSTVQDIARRYAKALFALAEERGQMQRMEKDMTRLETLFEENAALRKIAASPIVTRNDHKTFIADLADRMGLAKETRNFLCLLAQNRRLSLLKPVFQEWRALLTESRGEISVRVQTAKTLSPDQRKTLHKNLESFLEKKIVLEEDVSPSIIGGLAITAGSLMIDASLKTQLAELGRAMEGR